MAVEYKRVNDLLDEMEVCDKPKFAICCDNNSETFKLMRPQIRGKLSYTAKHGAYILNEEHDNKCMAIICKAKEEFVDLLLFPEYSISYNIIEKICINKDLWPERNKLWVLPCCGLGKKEFHDKMNKFSELNNVHIMDYGYGDKGEVEYKYFINAVFYIFVVNNGFGLELFLLPQIKTYSMKDIYFDCEEVGLSLGSKIFIFGENNGTILLSLLCADVMNPMIDWKQIQKMGSNCIVLNPQLNPSPRNKYFSRFRQAFFDGSIEAIMITCNWAALTVVKKAVDDQEVYGQNIEINLAWSCIYYKKDREVDFQDWAKENFDHIKEIEKKNLYAGIIKEYKTIVWYAGNEETIHILLITKLRIVGPGVKRPMQSIGYVKEYDYKNKKLSESRDKMFKLMKEGNMSENIYNEFQEILKDKFATYAFPFLVSDRCVADRFFDLVLGKIDWTFWKISDSEEVARYTIVLTNSERQRRNKAFSRYLYMVKALKNGKLPDHLKRRFEKAHILYWNEKRENHSLYERENSCIKENGKSILASYVESEEDAKELLARVKNNKYMYQVDETDICIITPSETDITNMVTYPKLNVDITKGKKVFASTDIAGGDINE